MEKYIFMVLGIILGIAIALYVYGVKKEHYAKKVKNDQDYFSTTRCHIFILNSKKKQ